jgi:alpha-galactosidase
LKTSEIVARRICETLKLSKYIEATLDRREALRGSDFVILMMQVGGYKPATVTDFDIPKKYGLRQTIADTLGIGGIFPWACGPSRCLKRSAATCKRCARRRF